MKSVSKFSMVISAFIEFLLGIIFAGLFIANAGLCPIFSTVMLFAILFISIGYFINSILLFISVGFRDRNSRDNIKMISVFFCKIIFCILFFYILKLLGELFLTFNVDLPVALGGMSFFFFMPVTVLLYLNIIIIKKLSNQPLDKPARKDIVFVLIPLILFSLDPLYEKYELAKFENIERQQKEARIKKAPFRAFFGLRNIYDGIKRFYKTNNRYPISFEELINTTMIYNQKGCPRFYKCEFLTSNTEAGFCVVMIPKDISMVGTKSFCLMEDGAIRMSAKGEPITSKSMCELLPVMNDSPRNYYKLLNLDR